jgi:ABC-2 type transport system ATP-binding protein
MAGTRGMSGEALEAAVERGIERFQLADVAKRLIGNLSKGFQQRVSLAQAFLHDPPLVIVDEPTGGLDPVQREYVQAVLHELQGDRTVLLCTHDFEEARRLTSNVAVLAAGRLVAHGSTGDVLDDDECLELFRPHTRPAR